MKVWKKNLVAAAVLVTVCAGIYVNWLYTEKDSVASLSDTLDYEKVMSEDGLMLTEDVAAITAGEDVNTTATDYFAAVRLSRQQARDNAFNMLQEAMTYSETDKAAESALDLEDIVQTALRFLAHRRSAIGGCGCYRGCGHVPVGLWLKGHSCRGGSVKANKSGRGQICPLPFCSVNP